MNDEARETLTLISEILEGLGTRVPVELLYRFLEDSPDEERHLSIEDLNEGLRNYLQEYICRDISTNTRVVKLGNIFLPLQAITKWTLEEKYSYLNNCPDYRIVLNSTEGHAGPWNNLVISYPTEEERQKDIEKLIELKLSWTQM